MHCIILKYVANRALPDRNFNSKHRQALIAKCKVKECDGQNHLHRQASKEYWN